MAATKTKIRDIRAIRWQKIKSTDFTGFADVAKEESVIFVLSVGKKIKSTDFTDFTDVAKQESVIFVLSVGKNK